MNLRDQKPYQPGQQFSIPVAHRGFNRKRPKRPKQSKCFGSEYPTRTENFIMGFATVAIMSLLIIATCMVFPDFCGQQIDKGRAVFAAAMGGAVQ